MPGKFVLKKTDDGLYQFNIKAGNGEIIATSQRYLSKRGALGGIQSVQENAANAYVEDQTGEE